LRSHARAADLVAHTIVDPKLMIQLSLVVSAQRTTKPLTRGLLTLVHKTALQVLSNEEDSARPGSTRRVESSHD